MKHFKTRSRPNKIRQNRPSVCLTQESRGSRAGGKGGEKRMDLRRGQAGTGGGAVSGQPGHSPPPLSPVSRPPPAPSTLPHHSKVPAARVTRRLHFTDAQIKAMDVPLPSGQRSALPRTKHQAEPWPGKHGHPGQTEAPSYHPHGVRSTKPLLQLTDENPRLPVPARDATA